MSTPQQSDQTWLKIGLRLFVESTGWIGLPVVASVILGRWLDAKFNSAPLFIISASLICLVLALLGICLTGIKYVKQIEQHSKNLKNGKEDLPKND